MSNLSSTSPWALRIKAAQRQKENWVNLFRCDVLQKYYEGFQWNIGYNNFYKPYVLNVIYSTLKLKLANILNQNPQYIIDPQPNYMDWDMDTALTTALMKQDALNTIIQNPRIAFAHNVEKMALDSFFFFGIMEIGYAADFRNPVKRPLIINEEDDSKENKEVADIPIVENERVYFKHIKAKRFYVGGDETILQNNHFACYYDFMYRSELEATSGVKLPKNYKAAYLSKDYGEISQFLKTDTGSEDMFKKLGSGQVSKVWHVEDFFNQKYMLFIDNYFEEPIISDVSERCRFTDLKWDMRAPSGDFSDTSEYYPIPPVFQWISSQDEINQAREQLRNYRKRFTRKFGYVKGSLDEDEIEKFKTERDGLLIEFKKPEAIFPIQNPEIGISIQEALSSNMSDLQMVTGTSAQARGASDRQTATQSKIIDVREQMRESVEQLNFDQIYIALGRQALVIVKEQFTEGFWIKQSLDQSANFAQEVQERQVGWTFISAQTIDDGYDEIIKVSVENGNPERSLADKNAFIEFITIVSTNQAIAMSPILIREAAYRCGYRNMRVIREYQKMAQLAMVGQIAGATQNQGGGVNPGGQNANNQRLQAQNSTPNPQGEVQAQLSQQV